MVHWSIQRLAGEFTVHWSIRVVIKGQFFGMAIFLGYLSGVCSEDFVYSERLGYSGFQGSCLRHFCFILHAVFLTSWCKDKQRISI
jgi:hypothetical protein